MAHIQIAEGGMVSTTECNREYFEVLADSRQGVAQQLGGWGRC